jgi:AcrR family transcriptional regulator
MQPVPSLREDPGSEHRIRLLEAMAAVVNEKGYAKTTVSDVVARARVSRRTFYEHFDDKQECLLALFAWLTDGMLDAIGQEAPAELPWEERVRATLHGYLSGLAANPSATATFLLEIQSAGPAAVGMRRSLIHRLVDVLLGLAADARLQNPSLRRLAPETAMMIVGGINELMLRAVEERRVHRLAELAESASALLTAALTAPDRRAAAA